MSVLGDYQVSDEDKDTQMFISFLETWMNKYPANSLWMNKCPWSVRAIFQSVLFQRFAAVCIIVVLKQGSVAWLFITREHAAILCWLLACSHRPLSWLSRVAKILIIDQLRAARIDAACASNPVNSQYFEYTLPIFVNITHQYIRAILIWFWATHECFKEGYMKW